MFGMNMSGENSSVFLYVQSCFDVKYSMMVSMKQLMEIVVFIWLVGRFDSVVSMNGFGLVCDGVQVCVVVFCEYVLCGELVFEFCGEIDCDGYCDYYECGVGEYYQCDVLVVFVEQFVVLYGCDGGWYEEQQYVGQQLVCVVFYLCWCDVI